MASRGVASFMESLGVALAKTSAPQANAQALREKNQGYFTSSAELCQRFALSSSSGKTSKGQKSGSPRSSQNSSQSVTQEKRSPFELLTLEHLTPEHESSASRENWVTPVRTNSIHNLAPAQMKRDGFVLITQAWCTPIRKDSTTQLCPAQLNRKSPAVVAKAFLSGHRARMEDGTVCPRHLTRLNPRFVEWLMQWPANWTAIALIDSPYWGTA
jgi:hypothetical protein